ncbi:hypothetical protein LVD15_06270 [Fulvivirga maritima]|uniref:hypothetical protein n=1 Tax=Fulvivirga maritima TaxID=2904247 RepID=UPI001F45A9F0|nr:hypothetical protein [Fulvivirga maritima]UII28027.1 hypothetical protein LVD15_06270 [Fulvivirga maritima]
MAFNGKEGEFISLQTAIRWTKHYQRENPGRVKAIFYGKEKLQQLLAEKDKQGKAVGLRIYFAKDDYGEDKLILVAATADENNILPEGENDINYMILDDGAACPPKCPGQEDLLA